MFAIHREILYRILVESPSGAWVIEVVRNGQPKWIDKSLLGYFKRVPTPDSFLKASEKKLSPAAAKRLALIQPMLEDPIYIIDRKACLKKATEIASAYATTPKRVRRLFYLYLATGETTSSKHSNKSIQPDFEWAIKTLYFSAKQMSLKQTYETMLLMKYTNAEGVLSDNYPSFDSFKHYYYRNMLHQSNQRLISRNGLTDYLRNNRPLHGSAMQWRDTIGCYQMDATTADIYVTSTLDRNEIVGRPSIYIAVDTATQLIAGIYVGFETGETAVAACLGNAARDKVELCKGYGLQISKDDWPNVGIPSEIITDKGREFQGKLIDEICVRFGTTLHSLPPFRPDDKSLVERMFGQINTHYKSLLKGKGVIQPDSQERWSTDYRAQATLNLHEFTEIILNIVVHLNSKRVLQSVDHLPVAAPNTPAALWRWFEETGKSSIISGLPEELYILTLPRSKGTLTRRGIVHEKLVYVPHQKCPIPIGSNVTYAYDVQTTDWIYVIDNNIYLFCISEVSQGFKGVSLFETSYHQEEQRKALKIQKKEELQSRIETTQRTKNIIDTAIRQKFNTTHDSLEGNEHNKEE